LAASTWTIVRHQVIGQQAQNFAEAFTQTLSEDPLAEVVALMAPAQARTEMSPREMLAQLREMASSGQGASPVFLALQAMKERVNSSDDQEVHLVEIENQGLQGTDPYAHIVIELHGSSTESFPKEHMYALLAVKASKSDNGQRSWYIENVTFPYEVGSRLQQVESAHSHAHGRLGGH